MVYHNGGYGDIVYDGGYDKNNDDNSDNVYVNDQRWS